MKSLTRSLIIFSILIVLTKTLYTTTFTSNNGKTITFEEKEDQLDFRLNSGHSQQLRKITIKSDEKSIQFNIDGEKFTSGNENELNGENKLEKLSEILVRFGVQSDVTIEIPIINNKVGSQYLSLSKCKVRLIHKGTSFVNERIDELKIENDGVKILKASNNRHVGNQNNQQSKQVAEENPKRWVSPRVANKKALAGYETLKGIDAEKVAFWKKIIESLSKIEKKKLKFRK
jgi:hypothetical protein